MITSRDRRIVTTADAFKQASRCWRNFCFPRRAMPSSPSFGRRAGVYIAADCDECAESLLLDEPRTIWTYDLIALEEYLDDFEVRSSSAPDVIFSTGRLTRFFSFEEAGRIREFPAIFGYLEITSAKKPRLKK